MKLVTFKKAVLALGLGFGLSASAMAGWGNEAACEDAGFKCIQQGNQAACVYLYNNCLD